MRKLEDLFRKIEVVALVLGILILVVFFIVSRLRGRLFVAVVNLWNASRSLPPKGGSHALDRHKIARHVC